MYYKTYHNMEIIGLDKNVSQFTVSSLSSGKMSYSAQEIDKVLLLLFIEMLNIVRKRLKKIMRLGI